MNSFIFLRSLEKMSYYLIKQSNLLAQAASLIHVRQYPCVVQIDYNLKISYLIIIEQEQDIMTKGQFTLSIGINAVMTLKQWTYSKLGFQPILE